jgi:hypothetical protein
MVKRLTVSTGKPTRKPMPAIGATEVEISAPVSKILVIEALTPAAN